MMTKTFPVPEGQKELEDLLNWVRQGSEIILTKDDKPVARVSPVAPEKPMGPRIPGLHPGSIWMSPDFDAELPDEFWLGEDTDKK